MKRSEFIKICSLLTAGVAVAPSFTWQDEEPLYSKKALMGLKSDDLVGVNYKLVPEAAKAFESMRKAALEEGIDIYSVSSYRSYYRQKSIWERKYGAFTSSGLTPRQAILRIIEYSTIPGTSRHHWGTDLDIVDRNAPGTGDSLMAKHFKPGGRYEKLHAWLTEHANYYGFYLVYTDVQDRQGFKYEPWHFSFKAESQPRLKEYLKLDVVSELKKLDFRGAEYFDEAFVSNYVKLHLQDINPVLL